MNEILKRKALRDDLTGLYNYGEIMKRLQAEINRAKRGNNELTIMMLDVDDFKSINNNYGHVTGDKVLAGLAETINKNIREIDIARRHGGDEFLIIFPDTNLNQAKIVAERMLNAIRKMDIEGIKITISAGLYNYSEEKTNEFVDKADKILYKAKKDTKNIIMYNKP